MLTTILHALVQLIGVGHIEVPHHHKGARGPVASAQIRMTRAIIELPRGSVAEVPHVNISSESQNAAEDPRDHFR